MKTNLLWIVLPPLIGFIINGLFCFKNNKADVKNLAWVSGSIATLAILVSFCASVVNFNFILTVESITGDVHLLQKLFQWISIDGFAIDMSLRFDKISAWMSLIITGIGSLIHFYSIGYMAHDKSVSRYFSYLNLFVFFMLILVLADSLAVMFIGWEGVGLCSYLLIGFWYTEIKNIKAANKAFIVNRVGDFAFLIGMFLIYNQFGTLNFSEINSTIASIALGSSLVLNITCILLFIGATGKSAQFPLYVWLPDAMAGPTPVSALIHAATMVTAGIYMIVRLSALFSLAPVVMQIIAIVGLLTAFLAATIALTQNDIKKVLAYSTISQLGYMFLACGVGAFTTAMFHLTTHAFFKALLFLGAGSVIHACSGEQDMTKMGGLRKILPSTHIVMSIGTLALAGIAPFAGFFSKDEILYSSLSLPWGNFTFYAISQFIALLTAIYSARMLILTFYGSSRMSTSALESVHESPWTMLIPLYFLACFSLLAGLIGLPHYFETWGIHLPNYINSYFSNIVKVYELPLISNIGLTEASVSLISLSLGLLTFIFSCILFLRITYLNEIPILKTVYRLWDNLYFIDKYYERYVVLPLKSFSSWIYRVFDRGYVDSGINQLALSFFDLGKIIRVMHNGNTQTYVLLIVIGFLISLFLLNFIMF